MRVWKLSHHFEDQVRIDGPTIGVLPVTLMEVSEHELIVESMMSVIRALSPEAPAPEDDLETVAALSREALTIQLDGRTVIGKPQSRVLTHSGKEVTQHYAYVKKRKGTDELPGGARIAYP